MLKILVALINGITFSRLILAFSPFFIQSNSWFLYFSIWAAFSDYADGLLARKLNLMTAFGATLDQFADKTFHFLFLFYLWQSGICDGIFILAFVLREILVLIFRKTGAVEKSSNQLGKWKTALTYALIIFALAIPVYFEDQIQLRSTTVIALEFVIIALSYISFMKGWKAKGQS